MTIKNTTREPPTENFPIIGIGASAGGLGANEAFFSGLTRDAEPGMAFVLVQHLMPEHNSLLAEILRRYTSLPVLEVQNGMAVQVNCVYVIAPNCDMALLNGTLQLVERTDASGPHLPIDFFFTSLARELHQRAIGIVLSGTGSDGTQGVRAIKAEGGLVMVESTAFTEFDGMPRNAIATGLVDYQLAPAAMMAQITAHVGRSFNPFSEPDAQSVLKNEGALKKIYSVLRAQTGHDFSQYKPNTIYRRIDRRMVVHQLDSMESYAKYLQQTPAEVEALFRDLLIGVTNFFRDPEAFKVLEQKIIPALLVDKPAGATLRVWCTGCSVGMEAYSLAILLQEHMDVLKTHYKVQVFATDIDSQAIAVARTGVFSTGIAADVSPERLARFFAPESNGKTYRVHKSIRDMLVFSEHDMIKDPPFSRLDLISCRNLLIYMGAELQKRLIPLFHYALNPGGVLFLGTSETIGEFGDLFAPLDRKAKLYQRKDDEFSAARPAFGRFVLPTQTLKPESILSAVASKTSGQLKPSLRELTEQALLQRLVSAAALVNAEGDILYLHGRSGMYLELPAGEMGVNNILNMARQGLRIELAGALYQAGATGLTVCRYGLNVKTNGHFTPVNLSVIALGANVALTGELPLYLVVLEESSSLSRLQPSTTPEQITQTNLLTKETSLDNTCLEMDLNAQTKFHIATLKQALWAKEEYLQATNEELETSNEELKSSNEEMQSVNEELQSSNEELETSKEELQSVNEELATVNAELHTKVVDLSQANNDMNNLLAGSGIATVFVDHKLRIMRYTPAATRVINLIPSDVGRPVAHVVTNLVGYDQLVSDTQAVLDTLMTQEVSVRTMSGTWYTLRILPYRTLDNVIEGAVITFLDITALKNTETALRTAINELQRLAVVVRDASDAITVQDLDGHIVAWNPGAVRLYGWSEAEALSMNTSQHIPLAEREAALAKVLQLIRAETLAPYVSHRLTKEGVVLEVSITSTALINSAGKIYAIATTERPVPALLTRAAP